MKFTINAPHSDLVSGAPKFRASIKDAATGQTIEVRVITAITHMDAMSAAAYGYEGLVEAGAVYIGIRPLTPRRSNV